MANSTQHGITRREFLIRSAAGSAGAMLAIAFGHDMFNASAAQAANGTPAFTPSIWFTITPDGKTTMHVVKAEMGQHIGTAFAQIIAEELEVKWDDIKLDYPLESTENFGVYGLAYTVNSGSVTTEFDRISRAGAAGRIAMIEAGCKLLNANESDCYAQQSRVIDKGTGRSIGYGEILQKAKIERKFVYPDDFKQIKLKQRADYKIIGKSIPALDIPAKTNGQAKYGIDVFLPNMLYGALVIPRARYGAKVTSIDDSEAKKDPGLCQSGEGRRLERQVHGLGGGAGGAIPAGDAGREGAQSELGCGSLRQLEQQGSATRIQTTREGYSSGGCVGARRRCGQGA